jgi:hypothetical protein
MYHRDGGDHCSTDDFLKAVDFARKDLKTFGEQAVAEREKSTSQMVAEVRRSELRLIRN